jgi:hypothetical protein
MPSDERVPGNTPERPADSQTPAAEAGLTSGEPPQKTSPERGIRPPLSRWAVAFGVLAALFVVVVGVVIYNRSLTTSAVPTEAQISERATMESLFQDNVPEAKGTGDRIDEWRAARSDHKIIAYAIARCRKVDISTMSPDTFSMLMLDLRPNGDHLWRLGAGPGTSSQPKPADQQVTQINGYEGAMLALSESVARGRVAAAGGAGGFYPQMWTFGWITVIVSALATMVVTLRATLTTTGWVPVTAGALAIFFSTAATVLTGAKQFWDPTNAYMRNEAALLALKQLHQDIALTFVASWDASKCQPEDSNDPEQGARFARWRNTLVSQQIGTMAAPVIVQNQATTASQPGNANAEPRARPIPAPETPQPSSPPATEKK